LPVSISSEASETHKSRLSVFSSAFTDVLLTLLEPKMFSFSGLSVALAIVLVPGPVESLKEGECEVCVTFLGKFYDSLKDSNTNFNSADIEKQLLESCKDTKGKDNRFVSKSRNNQTGFIDFTTGIHTSVLISRFSIN
ncbi:hypothetical protein GOODEAATRI_026261, partial [Goodea atripinnis]